MGYLNSCVMPEMPYCPVCIHGLIVEHEDSEFVDWICLLPTDRQIFEKYIIDRFMRVD